MAQKNYKIYLRATVLDRLTASPDEKIQIYAKREPAPKPPKYIIKDVKSHIELVNRVVLNGEHSEYQCAPFSKSNGKLRCMYTLEPIQDFPVGIPIAKRVVGEISTYYCVDLFATFNDAYAELKNRLRDRAHKETYSLSEGLLKELFAMYYPGETLVASLDNKLLEIFNGPMTIDEFRQKAFTITKMDQKYLLVPSINLITYQERL